MLTEREHTSPSESPFNPFYVPGLKNREIRLTVKEKGEEVRDLCGIPSNSDLGRIISYVLMATAVKKAQKLVLQGKAKDGEIEIGMSQKEAFATAWAVVNHFRGKEIPLPEFDRPFSKVFMTHDKPKVPYLPPEIAGSYFREESRHPTVLQRLTNWLELPIPADPLQIINHQWWDTPEYGRYSRRCLKGY